MERPCGVSVLYLRRASGSYLSGICRFHVRRCNAVLGRVRRVGRLVEAFEVALEFPGVREADIDRLRRAKFFAYCKLHGFLRFVIPDLASECMSGIRGRVERHRIDLRSAASVVPRQSTVAAEILMNLQCILMVDVCVTTSQLCGVMLGPSFVSPNALERMTHWMEVIPLNVSA